MIKRYVYTEREYTEQEVFDKRLFNVFVVSLPRSGSSMMVGILERLGVYMIYDTESKTEKEKRIKRYKEKLGRYVPNHFFGEMLPINRWKNLCRLMTRPYSGCKLIMPINDLFLQFMEDIPSRVIMMKRDPEEIRQSQNAFYAAEANLAFIESSLVTQPLEFEKRNIMYKIVEFDDVVKNREQTIRDIASFINATKSVDTAVNWVKPKNKRFNLNQLTVGI